MQITLSGFPPDEGVLTDILDRLAKKQINLSFLCLDATSGSHVSFCMTKADYAVCRELIAELLCPPESCSEIVTSVGTLTLFPHQSSLNILGHVLEVFGRNELPVYGVSSSISALAVNTDYRRLDQAAELLKGVFLLPENHAPFRQNLSVKNT